MDLRHMRHFVAVAEELHFGRAAKRLNIAQPPLSQSIRRLEGHLGVELFNRSRRSVELTDAGHVFLSEARRTLVQADLARRMAQRAAEMVPELRIAFIGPALYQVLPGMLLHYREKSPEVNVRLFERASPDQVQGILTGEYDIGFLTARLEVVARLERIVVERSNYIAAVPGDCPLAARETVSLAELADYPFISSPQKYVEESEPLAAFKNIGVVPSRTQETSQTNTTLSLVSAGVGCAFVMATAALTQWRNVRFIPLKEALPMSKWELAMAWEPAHLNPRVTDFLDFVRRYVDDRPELLDPSSISV